MKYVLAFLYFIITSQLLSQSASIKGQILNSEKEPIDLALVYLQASNDSTYIKSVYSDEDGSFEFARIPFGEYKMSVLLLGYESYSKIVDIQYELQNIPSITLGTSSIQVEEITITSKIPFIERKIDRTVINPEGLLSSAGSSAYDLMQKAPGLALNSDGSILLRGRSGVAVYINDKPSYLSGNELENYLRTLPTGSIKSIEIMTNPPAKYEAAGNSGVINIILKRNTLSGLNGNLSVSARQGRYTSSNNNLNLSYNKSKWSLYSNFNGGFYATYQDLNINRFYQTESGITESSFDQNSYNFRSGQFFNGHFGAAYYLNDKTTIGASLRKNLNPTLRKTDNNAFVRSPDKTILQTVVADNVQHFNSDRDVYNIYITHKIDTFGSSISFDADYVQYISKNDQMFINTLFDNNGALAFQNTINGEIPSTIKIYAAKTDYQKPINNNTRFEAGLKTAYTETDNQAIYSNTSDGVTLPDYGLSNQFLYDEWINAGYINFTKTFGKIDVQAGLRGEATVLNGNQLGNVEKPDTSFTRSYQSLFPTLYASWKMDETDKNILSFSYGRRINRPYFQDLNPFISPLDRFTFYTGNPNLLPTYSNNFSLTHSWNNKVNTSFSYGLTTDGINETLEIRDGIYYSRPGNISNSQSFTLSVDWSIDIDKWYVLSSYSEIGHLRFDSPLYTETLASRGTYYYISANNRFKLGKDWNMEISGNYRSDMVYSQLILKSYGSLNFGLRKKLPGKAGSFNLSISDILLTNRGSGIINNLRNTQADWNSIRDTRRVSLTYSLNFGNSTSNRKRKKGSGSDSEQRRVK